MGIPLDTAAIVGSTIECMLWGFSMCMFLGIMWSFAYRGKVQEFSNVMVFVAISFALLSTVHIVMVLCQLEQGFVTLRDTFPGGPTVYFGYPLEPLFVYKNVIYFVQTLIWDGVVIYRCWIVWQNIPVLIVPSLGWAAVLVSGSGVLKLLFGASPATVSIFAADLHNWITAYYASTFSTNLLSTALLAYRIWSVNRRSASIRHGDSSLRSIMIVIVDSGILYSATIICILVLYVINSNAQFVLLNLVVSIINIAFFMVLLRTGIMRVLSSTPDSSMLAGRPTVNSHNRHSNYPVQVHISQTQSERMDDMEMGAKGQSVGHNFFKD